MNVEPLSEVGSVLIFCLSSIFEQQLEHNLKFDFNMTGDDGHDLEPLFGPGLTGLRNLGNSFVFPVLLFLLSLLVADHASLASAAISPRLSRPCFLFLPSDKLTPSQIEPTLLLALSLLTRVSNARCARLETVSSAVVTVRRRTPIRMESGKMVSNLLDSKP